MTTPRDVIALSLSPVDSTHLRECPDTEYRRGLADAALEALNDAGYTVAPLEQIGWISAVVPDAPELNRWWTYSMEEGRPKAPAVPAYRVLSVAPGTPEESETT